MSLKIRIKQPIPSDAKPNKRRAQKIGSDDDEGATNAYYADVAEPQPKKARTQDRAVSPHSADDGVVDAVDEDVDIDGDLEDTRFLPEPQPSVSRTISPAPPSLKLKLSNPAASSSNSRPKESKPAKSSKSLGKKPRRQVVYTDSEDDVFDEPDVVVTDDEDFDLGLEQSSKKGAKGKSGKALVGTGKASGKGKVKPEEKEKEKEKEMLFRDERKVHPPELNKRVKHEDVVKNVVPDPLDDPIPRKRKLPPIKKNRPAVGGFTGPSTPAAVKSGTTTAVPSEKKETLTPALTSNQVGARKVAGASSDINLLDSSVYSELFKSAPGGVAPNSGLNRKQKEEERKKELNKMRMEARAKRDAESKHAFNLQAAPEKIQRYEEVLRSRHSMARFPNIIGAALKEMFDQQRSAQSSTAAVGHR